METIDEEVLAKAVAFIRQAHAEGRPFFVWFNSTRMHIFTHLKPESRGVTGLGIYADGMVEFDKMVGVLLDLLEELRIVDDTIVMWSTDNGAEVFSWPDGGTTPFRGEKNTCWEGGWRVPTLMRWPGVIKPGSIINDIASHEDMLPTLLAAAGDADVKQKLLTGMKVGNRTYKVHLDGYDLGPALAGKASTWPRDEMLYWSDDGDMMALRFKNWKAVFAEQTAEGFEVWRRPLEKLRLPLILNLRSDPFERAPIDSIYYDDWMLRRAYLLVPAQAYIARWIESLKEFPPRQKPASFSIEQVMEKLQSSHGG
jgi:arylsulfatase A-like enzyme